MGIERSVLGVSFQSSDKQKVLRETKGYPFAQKESSGAGSKGKKHTMQHHGEHFSRKTEFVSKYLLPATYITAICLAGNTT